MNKWGLILMTILLAAGVSVASFKIMEHNFRPVHVKDQTGKIHFVSESSSSDSSAEIYPDLTWIHIIRQTAFIHLLSHRFQLL